MDIFTFVYLPQQPLPLPRIRQVFHLLENPQTVFLFFLYFFSLQISSHISLQNIHFLFQSKKALSLSSRNIVQNLSERYSGLHILLLHQMLLVSHPSGGTYYTLLLISHPCTLPHSLSTQLLLRNGLGVTDVMLKVPSLVRVTPQCRGNSPVPG